MLWLSGVLLALWMVTLGFAAGGFCLVRGWRGR